MLTHIRQKGKLVVQEKHKIPKVFGLRPGDTDVRARPRLHPNRGGRACFYALTDNNSGDTVFLKPKEGIFFRYRP